jgi:hypothetical protein
MRLMTTMPSRSATPSWPSPPMLALCTGRSCRRGTSSQVRWAPERGARTLVSHCTGGSEVGQRAGWHSQQHYRCLSCERQLLCISLAAVIG